MVVEGKKNVNSLINHWDDSGPFYVEGRRTIPNLSKQLHLFGLIRAF